MELKHDMIYEFEATHVGYDDDHDAMTVAFGGLPDEDNYPRLSFMLQRSTDENEDEPGEEGVYAEWCDQSMSDYDLIDQFILCRDAVEVVFREGQRFTYQTLRQVSLHKRN